MSYWKKIEYEMIPRESFLVIRGCAKCGRKTHFINTEKFRVNANGNKLDVWLIYQCEECKHTFNLAIYERQKVSSIPKEEYQRFLDNDEELARRYGTDLQLFQKNKAEIDFERVSVDFVKKYDTKENSGSGAATADFFLCECCPCREIQINSELKHIAVKIPYNKAVIAFANPYLALFLRFTGIPKEVHHRKFSVAGYRGLECKVDVFEPAITAERMPALLYAHGGAFSYRASVYHKKLACIYAAKAKCRVYFPDYHLMPKYSYPAAYEDVLALYRYMTGHTEELGIDQERLKKPCAQMLVYPLLDFRMQTASMKKFTDTPLWNAKNNRRFLHYYCGHLSEEEKYAAFPLYDSLPKDMPDTYIETAEYDCLHDEGILYGKRLREAGADATINETRGTVHGYDSALNTRIAIRNSKKRIRFLLRAFYGG